MRWELIFAWVIAALCSLLALRLLRSLRLLGAPEPRTLLSELLAEVGASSLDSEFARRSAIAELNRRLSDISFELGSLPARFTALTRICLASGTALALFRYIGASASSATAIERVLVLVACGASGVVGAACVLAVGRVAKQKTSVIREEWDRSSREAGKSLGTSLEAPVRERTR
ncbi:MAG TPA: hypothetical protein VER11_21140 [Polyangiaceae bacterium]|nr:hypothetical protein [Polyangiaceae bacterium]